MKTIKIVPHIEWIIATFLVVGGALFGTGLAYSTWIPAIMGVLFVAVGTIALLGTLSAYREAARPRRRI